MHIWLAKKTPSLEILRLAGKPYNPNKIDKFPPLEPGMGMDATLAPPRNQLDHLENHWNSLHFQGPALMGDSARQRYPGGQ